MSEAQTYYDKADSVALEGLSDEQAEQARPFVRRVVDDLLRQADEDDSLGRDELVEIGLADLQRDLEGKSGDERVAGLQALALRPAVQKTSGRAFELATKVADGETAREQAVSEATELQQRVLGLMQDVKQLADEDARRRLMRALADADLEVRFVLEEEEGAISLRLNRHIHG